MACYISSNNNRFYAAVETAYGRVAAITEKHRLPAVKLAARQAVLAPNRRDKTGVRTHLGLPHGLRKVTEYEVTTLLTEWAGPTDEPGYGALFRGVLGAPPVFFAGGTVASMLSGTQMRFAAAHGLMVDQAVACDGEIRFVSAVADAQTVVLNAPLSSMPASGTAVQPTVTYLLHATLDSVSIFDFWDPQSSVQRILAGAAVDELRMSINGDFHQFTFRGPAAELLDTASFASGQAGLTSFPTEPLDPSWNHTLVPGNLGQAWLGSLANQFFTITTAEVVLRNGIELRSREFGTVGPSCLVPGPRSVELNFRLYGSAEANTVALYEAARSRSPIPVMFQLGQQARQLCGVWMKAVVPEVPEFDDDEQRLQWKFTNCQAQGVMDDEIAIAFA